MYPEIPAEKQTGVREFCMKPEAFYRGSELPARATIESQPVI